MKKETQIYTSSGHLIKLQQQKIYVEAQGSSNHNYAFYLTCNSEIEKIFYSSNRQIVFESEIQDGTYVVSIFIKDENNNAKIEKIFLIVQNGRFVQNEIVAEAKNYKIVLYDLKSDITFIVFNGAASTKEYRGFGLSYLLSRGYNVITCAQNNDQYQGLSFDTFKELVEPLIVGKKVFLYGSSLGGYCALYYAGAVNGTVIAAAPKNSAHPKMIKKTSNFNIKDFKHADIINNPITDKPVYIFIDPYVKSDLFFMNEFIKPAYPSCNILEFPYAGHEVLYHINKLKSLSPLITMIVSGDEVDIFSFEQCQDTEFTLYGKALDAYRSAIKYIDQIESSKSIHPVVSKKLQWLNRKIK